MQVKLLNLAGERKDVCPLSTGGGEGAGESLSPPLKLEKVTMGPVQRCGEMGKFNLSSAVPPSTVGSSWEEPKFRMAQKKQDTISQSQGGLHPAQVPPGPAD